MDELELVRQHATAEASEDEIAHLRRQVATRTWDGLPLASPRPTEETGADAAPAGPRSYVERHRAPSTPRWRHPIALAAAVVVMIAVIYGGARSLDRTEDDPATDPSPASLEAALPHLLDIDWRLRWPDVAWDASQAQKDAFEAGYRPEMEQMLTEAFSTNTRGARREHAEISLTRAVNGPQTIVDETAVTEVAVEELEVDGDTAEAIVTYRYGFHVLRDPNPPGQLGTFSTGPDGWWSTTDRARVTLTWEGAWKLDHVMSLKPI